MRLGRAFLITLRDRPALIAWGLFVASLPFYVGRSGLPQPGNALMFLALPLALKGWDRRLDTGTLRTLRALAWFVVWVIVINAGWVIVTGIISLAGYAFVPIYYVWNLLVVFCAVVLHRRYGDVFLRATLYALLFDVAFQVLASFVYRTNLYRGELFFNNPNQLGYWALLAACAIALLQKHLRLGLLKATASIVGCAYLAVLSASRAAVAGIAILLVLLVFTNPRVLVVAIFAGVLFVVAGGGQLDGALESPGLRAMQNRDINMSFAEERGYQRMWDFKEYILVGAGEGDIMRFVDDPKRANEIHSSLGTVVFSYGIVGTILFLLFFARLLRGASTGAIVLLVPVLVYTVAHQGLRFSLFWMVLALFAALKVRPKQ